MPLIRFALKRITSKWLILFIEQGLVLLSLGLTLLLYEILTLVNFSVKDVFSYGALALVTGLMGSLMFHTHKNIIRYSEIRDISKVLQSVFAGFVFWVFVLLFFGKSLLDHQLPYTLLIVHATLTAMFLIGFRVFVREIYYRLIKQLKSTQNILIYGAGQEGISTKRAIEIDSKNHFHVAAYLDDDPDKIGKNIGGVPVYSGKLESIQKLIELYQVNTIILSSQDLLPNRKLELSDFCQAKQIELKTTPPLNQWTEGIFRFNQLRNVTIEMLLERPVIKIINVKTAEEMRDKVVLVTGAAGSIGSELCRQLLNYPVRRILALDQSETGLYELSNEMLQLHATSKFLPLLASVRDYDAISGVMKTYSPDFVFHAAAYKHVPLLESFPLEVLKTNILGTLNVLKAASNHDVKKFIMISTDKAVNPTNLMGTSKRIAEKLVHQFENASMKCVITRFGNVLGSNGSVVPIFKKQIEAGGPITVTHQDITRYFMTIPEASSLVLEAATMGNDNEVFVFDMGEPVRILDLAKKMIRLSGLEPHRDIEIAITGLRPGEKLYEELFTENEKLNATHHPKIMRAKFQHQQFSVDDYIMRLAEVLQHSEPSHESLKNLFAELVPEYVNKD